MFPRVTIKDIAKLAGVSPGTVDRVIHNRGNVSKQAREEIERAMQELGYEPNIIASTLAYNRMFRVVALLPDYKSDLYWEQPRSGIEKASLAVRHYGINLEFEFFPIVRPERFLEQAERILHTAPDALLFAPLFQEESSRLLFECSGRHIPAALINTNLEDQEALCYVGQDSYQSGVLAGKLLHLGLNAGEGVAVLNLDYQIMHAKHLLEKERGLRDYFSRHPDNGNTVQRVDFEEFDNSVRLREFLLNLFSENPALRGVFVSNSRAYRLFEALGDEIPPGLRVVGFDLLPPNLAYLESDQIAFLINQNPVQQGYQAVMSIVNHLIFKKEVERVQYLPLDIVVAENASYYLAKEKAFQVLV